MSGRKVISIGLNKKHLTQKERQKRGKNEQKLKEIRRDRIRPPKWLDDTARKEFLRIAKELKSSELLANVDVGALAICCDAYSKFIGATEAMRIESTDKNRLTAITCAGTDGQSPYVSIANRYAMTYRRFYSEFGLTPSCRLKLTLPQKEEEVDPFVKLFG